MNTPEAPPSPIRRLLPWLLAIGLGVGVGWVVGGLFGSDERAGAQAVQSGTQTPPAPPPAAPTGASPAPAAASGPPMALTISNRDCNWGADFDSYYQQGTALMAQAGSGDAQQMASVRVRVPARPWQGLTVTAVEAVHEGGGIIFAEPEAAVRAALARAGVTVDADGTIPLTGDADPGVAQSLGPTSGSAVRYGATLLACGA
jgi:hypothetical protein